jgi:hypothetical protein
MQVHLGALPLVRYIGKGTGRILRDHELELGNMAPRGVNDRS